MRTDLRLSPADIAAIEDVLANDQRVMIIPTKERFKIVRVRHDEVKPIPKASAKTELLTKY